MTSDLTNLTNASNIYGMVNFLNQESGGMFSTLLVISFSVILAVILLRRSQPLVAIWVSCLATTFLCFLFMLASLVNWYIFLIYFLITVVITFLRYVTVG